MAQAKTLTTTEIERLLTHINTRKYAARNRSMMLLTHWAGLRIGEVACLRWSDVTNTDGQIKDEIRLLPDMTKGRHARTVFVSAKLKAELHAYALQAKCVDRNYPFFASQKSIRAGFNANSLAQTFAVLYAGAGLEGASSHSGRRTFLTNLANKGTAIHILKTLAGHRSISTTAAYLYSSPSQLKAAVELVWAVKKVSAQLSTIFEDKEQIFAARLAEVAGIKAAKPRQDLMLLPPTRVKLSDFFAVLTRKQIEALATAHDLPLLTMS